MLQFDVIGIPKAQPRAKACIRGLHASVYDPGTANDWKTSVKVAAAQAWNKLQFTAPVSLSIEFRIPRPKSHFRASGDLKPNAPVWAGRKPDLDNLEKAIMDALTDLGVWSDDALVVSKATRKVFCQSTGERGASLKIQEVATQ